MVAVFDVVWDFAGTVNTPGTTEETLTNLRFQAEDTNDQDTAAPVVIVTASTEFAFWKHIYLDNTTAPDTQVDNVRIHTDGTLGWTGCVVRSGDGTQTKTSVSDAGYDPGQALVLTTHDTISALTDFFTFTSGAPRTVSISEAGNIINAINEKCDYVVLQLEVTDTAVPGVQATETITWLYDEI